MKALHRVMLVAGEASGDKHASKLVARLQRHSSIQCYGMGLQEMEKSGVELLVNAKPLAVIGLVEVIRHYPALRHAFQLLKQSLINTPPDLLILIDYPEFNLKLARIASRLGIKVLFYISPQLWAWRPYRIKKIKRYVNQMLVILPFEADFYAAHGVAVEYVGHPLIEDLKDWERHHTQLPNHSDSAAKTILLLPGSRSGEIKCLLPLMCSTAKLIKQQFSNNIQFRLLPAPDIHPNLYAPYLNDHSINCSIANESIYTEMKHADLAISATGTATLQLALCGTPLIATHKVSRLSYWLLKWFITIPFLSLPNIIANRPIVPEYLQNDATPEKLCQQACELLSNQAKRQTMKQELLKLREQFGNLVASEQTEKIVCKILGIKQ